MQVARFTAVALLLALSSCREEPPKQAEVFEPVASAPEAPGTAVPERAAPVESEVVSTALPPQPPQGTAADITAGISRDRLMELLGDCAFRLTFVAGDGKGSASLEVFQPKAGECVERFKEHRYFVRGNTLESVQPGLDLAAVEALTAPAETFREDIRVSEN